MRRLTEATVHDSATMKQISFLSMVFLPFSLVAVSPAPLPVPDPTHTLTRPHPRAYSG